MIIGKLISWSGMFRRLGVLSPKTEKASKQRRKKARADSSSAGNHFPLLPMTKHQHHHHPYGSRKRAERRKKKTRKRVYSDHRQKVLILHFQSRLEFSTRTLKDF